MRLSSYFEPFSCLAFVAAVGALGVTVFPRAACAADPAAANALAQGAALGKPTASAGAASASASVAPPDKQTKDAARKAYSDAEKAYSAGDYGAAYAGYARANELIPSAHAAYWAAKSLDQSGKIDEAIKGYEALLADPGATKIGEEKLADAHTRLATLKEGQVGEVTVSSAAAGAVLSVDGAPRPGPLPLVLKLAPGPHKLTLTAPGFDAKEVEVQVQAGTRFGQVVNLEPHVDPAPPAPLPPAPPAVPEIAAPAPPPPPPPEPHSKLPGFVTLGIATGGAIVGTIFGVQALQSKSDYNKNPTTNSADDTERNALIADMAFGVAVTLGVTGIVLLTSSDDGIEAAPKSAKLHPPVKGTFRMLPYVGREGGGAAARLTF